MLSLNPDGPIDRTAAPQRRTEAAVKIGLALEHDGLRERAAVKHDHTVKTAFVSQPWWRRPSWTMSTDCDARQISKHSDVMPEL